MTSIVAFAVLALLLTTRSEPLALQALLRPMVWKLVLATAAGQLPPSTGRATSPLVSLLEVTLATFGVPRQPGRAWIWPAIAT